MPTLHWIGKEKVINHHLDVPYRALRTEYAFGDARAARENLIVHGDNLEALKALLPQYEGRVKVVCIDPPYNTGNESWVYNDNVNDPKIRKWLGQTVGREGEDLSRHDKWLCMMYPRLKLLHKLLRDDGSIWVCIDDNEVASLRYMLDEIFGATNFVASVVWQKRTSPDARLNLGPAHDYILVYTKKMVEAKDKLNKVNLSEIRTKEYKNPDNDPRGVWASVDITGQTGHATSEQFYGILLPNGMKIFPPENRCWALAERTFLELLSDNRIWFGKNGDSRPRLKKFLNESEGSNVWTWWTNEEVGHNQEAKKELIQIFTDKEPFDTPKPTRLIERILQISAKPDSAEPDIILDSFAGSGTTAHAVLKLNRADGGNRRFILIEMEDYARTITAERVRRVISGYGPAGKEIPGTGGGFSYLSLGPELFAEDGSLNPEVPEDDLRRYVWYAETKAPSPEPDGGNPHFLGSCRDVSYYFFYRKGGRTTLDYEFLKTIEKRDEQYVIYADACALDAEYLKVRGIQFKKIPRDIPRC